MSDVLMRRVATGDHDAFEQLYLLLAPGVYGLALCIAGDRGTAADVTRAVFAETWARAPSFDIASGTARARAMTATHRLALDARGERAPGNTSSGTPAHDTTRSHEPGPGALGGGVPVWSGAAQELGITQDQQQLAVSLAYFAGFTLHEVARSLHLPESTVRTHMRDGLRRLAVGAPRLA